VRIQTTVRVRRTMDAPPNFRLYFQGVVTLHLLRPQVPSEPLSTLILEQHRPPAGNVVIGKDAHSLS
jgi:hypothetical protein